MARPQKQTVDYFPHQCKHGKTMFILESNYPDHGYRFWFKLLEVLGDTEGHAYYFDKSGNCEYLQAYTKAASKEQAIGILTLLAGLDAIDKKLWNERHLIWSDNFIDGIKDAYRKRIENIPVKPFSDVGNPQDSGVSGVGNPQRKLKETKVNKSKVNNTNPNKYTKGKYGHLVKR